MWYYWRFYDGLTGEQIQDAAPNAPKITVQTLTSTYFSDSSPDASGRYSIYVQDGEVFSRYTIEKTGYVMFGSIEEPSTIGSFPTDVYLQVPAVNGDSWLPVLAAGGLAVAVAVLAWKYL